VRADGPAGYQIHTASARDLVLSAGSRRAESVQTWNRLPTAYAPVGRGPWPSAAAAYASAAAAKNIFLRE
jgi:hypothetical protein